VRVILLGPQRRPALDLAVRALGLDGPFATVTAGWQEREPDDGELSARLGGRAVNLGLYRRWLDVQERDPEYTAAERRLQEILAELREVYLLRLDYALGAVYAVQRRPGVQAAAVEDAVAAVRKLDAAHLRLVGEVRGEFFARLRPHDRPVIAGHRGVVADALASSAALVVTGGHVGVLADVLHLFNVAAALRGPVIAWSAGAMALADRIVLFHDRSAQGPSNAEVYGAGLSVLRGVVPLPHAKTRLLLEDTPRMEVFARRFAPARCLLLEAGARVDADDPAGARVLAQDGHVTTLAAA
jgi:hypothetical protein